MNPQPWRMRRLIPAGPSPWRRLSEAWGLSDAAARLCWLRGLDQPEDLAWRLDSAWDRTFDPHLLSGMGEACARVKRAIEAQEKVIIYGDYDVDGVTATSLLTRVLERMGAQVAFFIPDRFNDGYGLHLDCIQELAVNGANLVISVDCGVRSVEEVRAGRELGLDWIITDHHSLGPELPEAVAVLHPQLGDYPNRHLAGVGVAFKLAQALMDAVPTPKGSDVPFLDGLLKLVALGTVADMVPLVGENALLVRRGLQALGGSHGAGLTALLQEAKIQGVPRAQELAFGPAPRINAAGRMGAAGEAVRLLLAREAGEAKVLAEAISLQNEARREVQRQVLSLLPEPDGLAFDLVVHPDAHKGVVGIVAAQRMRRTGLPTGVGMVIDGIAHCSLRAPEGYDCNALLEAARPFLRSGGGHRAAAGMTFPLKHLSFVRKALVEAALLQADGREASAVLVDVLDVKDLPGLEELLRLEPFGQGFPEPVVLLEGRVHAPVQSFGQGHARIKLAPHAGDVVWFFADPDQMPSRGDALACAVCPNDHPRFGRSWRLEAFVAGGAS